MDYALEQLIDLDAFRGLMASFHEATGVPMGLLAPDGAIIHQEGEPAFCALFHEEFPDQYRACHTAILERSASRPPEDSTEVCPNKLEFLASPVVIRGAHVATCVLWHFRMADMADSGIPGWKDSPRADALDAAYQELAILDMDALRRVQAHFLSLVSHLSETGLQRLRQLSLESKIRDEQKRLRFVLEATSDGVWDWDIRNDTLYFSARWYTMLGYDAYELPPNFETLRGLQHPDDQEKSSRFIQSHMNEGTRQFSMDFRMRRKDGTWAWINSRGKVVERDEAGRPVRMVGTHTDITAQKLADLAVQDSEARFRTIFQNLTAGVALLDLEGRILQANSALQEMTSTAQPLLPGSTRLHELVLAEDRERVRACVQQRGSGDCNALEIRLRTHDGGTLWTDVSLSPILSADGTAVALVGILTDITDRKLTQNALQRRLDILTRPEAAEEGDDLQFRDLFDLEEIQAIQDAFAKATGVASIITDTQGKPLTTPSCFTPLCSLIRKTEKGLDNCMHSDKILGRGHPEGPIVQPCLSGGLLDGGTSIMVGGKHMANWLIGQVVNDDADKKQLHGYAREIGADQDAFDTALSKVPSMSLEQFTQVAEALYHIADLLSQQAHQNVLQARAIRQLETTKAALRRAREDLDMIFNAMPSILVRVDMQGRVLNFNHSAAEQAPQICTRNAIGLSEVFPHLAPLLESAADHLGTGLTYRAPRVEVRTPAQENGAQGTRIRYEDVTIFPLMDDESQSAVIRVDDITPRVQIEDMMVQTEKMISIGGLAAGMAHEINNPLGGILQGAQNVVRRLSPDMEANQRAAREYGVDLTALQQYLKQRNILRALDGIREAGNRAAHIVSAMLEFSRKSESRRAPADIHEVLERSLELASNDYDLKKSYDFRRIDIVRDFDPDLPSLPCTRTELEQVFLNILKNAAQAMAGRKPDSPAPQLILRTRLAGGNIRVSIADNGPGMPDSVRKRIFEPFYTTKPVGMGTGLGMAVSYFIVTQNHGGAISVESAPSRGATFHIELPSGTMPSA